MSKLGILGRKTSTRRSGKILMEFCIIRAFHLYQNSSEPRSLAGITTIHWQVISELRRLLSLLPGNTTGILSAKTSKPMSKFVIFHYHQKRSDTSFIETSNRCRYFSSLERLVDGFCLYLQIERDILMDFVTELPISTD